VPVELTGLSVIQLTIIIANQKKYIRLMNTDNTRIYENIATDRKVQSQLFYNYFSRMYNVCRRFARNNEDAKDILQEGFIKIFANINSFRSEGSLESWMKRIMINTSYNFYKRRRPSNSDMDFDQVEYPVSQKQHILDQFLVSDLNDLINELPEGYKTVFNLSAVEGYTHNEISKKLNISKNTSKSQLNRAKTSLREKISSIYHFDNHSLYYEHCLS
jgi:RNA polymerase sigma-70 factor (ECF subfamily)